MTYLCKIVVLQVQTNIETKSWDWKAWTAPSRALNVLCFAQSGSLLLYYISFRSLKSVMMLPVTLLKLVQS